MASFLVTQREVIITSYLVEAESEEEAIEEVQAGEGVFAGRITEPYLDPDEWEVEDA